MKRTTVYVDEDDLATIKTAAARRGVPEAELIRDAIHLAALADRTWDEPFLTRTYVPVGGVEGVDSTAEQLWEERAVAYGRTKNLPR